MCHRLQLVRYLGSTQTWLGRQGPPHRAEATVLTLQSPCGAEEMANYRRRSPFGAWQHERGSFSLARSVAHKPFPAWPSNMLDAMAYVRALRMASETLGAYSSHVFSRSQ